MNKKMKINLKKECEGKKTVCIANELLQSSQELDTIAKKRIISIAVSNINSKLKKKLVHFDSDFCFEITAEEYSTISGVDIKSSYRQMKEAADKLLEKGNVIKRRILEADGSPKIVRGEYEYESFVWVQHITYSKGNGRIELTLSKRVTDFLCDIRKNYTYFLLERACRLKSVYAFRFFEMMMQYYSTGWFVLEINEFCRLLGAPDCYKDVIQLVKTRLIKPILKELSGDFLITWKGLKKRGGKRITHIEFKFKENTQLSLI